MVLFKKKNFNLIHKRSVSNKTIRRHSSSMNTINFLGYVVTYLTVVYISTFLVYSPLFCYTQLFSRNCQIAILVDFLSAICNKWMICLHLSQKFKKTSVKEDTTSHFYKRSIRVSGGERDEKQGNINLALFSAIGDFQKVSTTENGKYWVIRTKFIWVMSYDLLIFRNVHTSSLRWQSSMT